MAVYAIGDLQGCLDALHALLTKINFNSDSDTLWFTGDLINRGGQSLETLTELHAIRDNIVSVLGNHDLHCIAAYYGHKQLTKNSDLNAVLNAPHADELIQWLTTLPLLHHERIDSQHDYTLVHAGIAPHWTLSQARAYAAEVETVLRSHQRDDLLANMYGNSPTAWSDDLVGHDRLRCIVNHFTRMRYVTDTGDLELKSTMHPKDAPTHLTPWFHFPNRPARNDTILIGHWASLAGDSGLDNVMALDTGYVWGGALTALNLNTHERISIEHASR
ncbi:MAG: symmetrical bis(5'-nucleosyl)-tetraphosphatase [Pseudomonadota bacterium]